MKVSARFGMDFMEKFCKGQNMAQGISRMALTVGVIAMLPMLGFCGDTTNPSRLQPRSNDIVDSPHWCEVEKTQFYRHVGRSSTGISRKDATGSDIRLGIILRIHGPEGKTLLKSSFPASYNPLLPEAPGLVGLRLSHKSLEPKLETVVDETGKDLIGKEVSFNGSDKEDSCFGNDPEDLRPTLLGSMWLADLEAPAENAKSLLIVKGVLRFSEVVEEDRVEIKPLSAHLKTPIVLSDGTAVSMTRLEKNTLAYTIKWLSTPFLRKSMDLQIKLYGADGTELKIMGHNDGAEYNVRLADDQNIPKDAYAIITYPTKTKTVEIPFEFKNVQLP